jgi:hypothetical protein
MRCFAAASVGACGSVSRTCHPARAKIAAQAQPIRPVPTMATVFGSDILTLIPHRLNRIHYIFPAVMPALVAGIHVLETSAREDVDGRDKPGHDERGWSISQPQHLAAQIEIVA